MDTQHKMVVGAAFSGVQGKVGCFPFLLGCVADTLLGNVIVQERSPAYAGGPVSLPGRGTFHWPWGGK